MSDEFSILDNKEYWAIFCIYLLLCNPLPIHAQRFWMT